MRQKDATQAAKSRGGASSVYVKEGAMTARCEAVVFD